MKYQKSEKGRKKHNETHARWKKKNETKLIRKYKEQAVNYKGGMCSRCSYSKCMSALEFHHLFPETKVIGISVALGQGWNLEKLKSELDKCILLCSNCHRELHYLTG